MYAILLLLWSSGTGSRYMIPVIPFFFYYIVCALDLLRRKLSSRQGLLVEGSFLILVSMCYGGEYRQFHRAD